MNAHSLKWGEILMLLVFAFFFQILALETLLISGPEQSLSGRLYLWGASEVA